MELKGCFEDTLARWEEELRQYVEEFDRYGRAMSELDCHLFDYVTKLTKCQQEHSEIEMMQQDIINKVARIEAKQKAMMDVVGALQTKVGDIQKKEQEKDNSIEQKAREVNNTIHKLESCVIALLNDLDKVENNIYTEELAELVHAVNVHNKWITQLEMDFVPPPPVDQN